MSKWLWALIIIVALGVTGYFTGIIKFSGHVDVTEDHKVVYESGTQPAEHHKDCGDHCDHDHH